ncbi:ABC transporter permease [Hansschlegelia plantiphila]|uniref:ABC transporter permease n=1 Tax=Hansschlegelia plantiphila TaxID=374655 RepID=A0A9W6IYT2_9HYPH|nr:ABC transporter permease [Hansschlegelia plantiphila]GLK67177.1 ABC transporter permease [Hansschlegelia plantiphila]
MKTATLSAEAPPATAAAPETLKPAASKAADGVWAMVGRANLRPVLVGFVSIALFVLVWRFLTVNRIDLYVRFMNVPSPDDVLESAKTALSSAQFADHVLMSCRRILYGFTLAAVVAVPLGLLMGRFKLLSEIVFPVAEVMRPIPAIAWVPMSIMLWPTNEQSIVFITFLGSFFPILLNTLHGMANVDPVLVRAARCLGASEAATFREVYLPATLPQIFTGLTVGMGVAWVSLIAAEMISGQFGIGYFTWEAYSLVQYPDIALGMITIGVLGLASSWAIRLIGRLAMPWSAK